MFIPCDTGATASTDSAVITPVTSPILTPVMPPEQIRHLLFGTPAAANSVIALLHKLGYAEPNDWSRLISIGRAGEVMAILTKRV